MQERDKKHYKDGQMNETLFILGTAFIFISLSGSSIKAFHIFWKLILQYNVTHFPGFTEEDKCNINKMRKESTWKAKGR